MCWRDIHVLIILLELKIIGHGNVNMPGMKLYRGLYLVTCDYLLHFRYKFEEIKTTNDSLGTMSYLLKAPRVSLLTRSIIYECLKWRNSVYRSSMFEGWIIIQVETLLFQFIVIWINFPRICTSHIPPRKEHLLLSLSCHTKYEIKTLLKFCTINFHVLRSVTKTKK